jgi:transcription antitermination factor NusG
VKTAGVVRLIGTHQSRARGGRNRRIVENHGGRGVADLTGHRLQQGDRVLVVNGPFAGVSGTFVRYRGQGRVVVNIEALGQSAGVDVQEEDVETLPPILSS